MTPNPELLNKIDCLSVKNKTFVHVAKCKNKYTPKLHGEQGYFYSFGYGDSIEEAITDMHRHIYHSEQNTKIVVEQTFFKRKEGIFDVVR